MDAIAAVLGPLHEIPGHNPADPARPYRLEGAKGTLGFISSVTNPFCAGCNRVRLTADGKLRLCLLRDDEVDLMTPLRNGAPLDEMRRMLRQAVYRKPWGHGLAEHVVPVTRVMSQIGG
jgi:cyclic pyranopterin phosphate synthase